MLAFGSALIAYGLLRKQIKLRDGTVVRNSVPKALARSWFVLLGFAVIIMAVTYGH